MKRILGAISALAMLGLISVAQAAESSGKIQAVDPPTRTVALDDGNTYLVHPAVPIEQLKQGEAVKVAYEEQGGQKIIIEVQPAE